MNEMYHTLMGWTWLNIPALIVLLAVIVIAVVRYNKLKKIERELKDRLSEVYADETEKKQQSPR